MDNAFKLVGKGDAVEAGIYEDGLQLVEEVVSTGPGMRVWLFSEAEKGREQFSCCAIPLVKLEVPPEQNLMRV